MNEQFIINTDGQQSLGELRLHFHVPKKYALSKTIPVYQKDSDVKFFQERTKRKSKTPEYFTNILKEQKKNMFVNTFLRKLKSSIILRRPPLHPCLNENNRQTEQDDIQLQVPKIIQLMLLIVWSLHAFSLLILNSMAMIFNEIDNSQTYRNFMILSFLLHTFQMVSKCLIHWNYQENKLTKIKQITYKYLQEQLWYDGAVFIGIIMFFILKGNDEALIIFRLLIFVKIRSLLYIVEHLEITLIENQYRQQIWSLIKVFIFNFTFAHILTLALILMARIKEDDSWLVSRDLYDEVWSEKYIWGYYWATTIMLTVGFGDITPRNSSQALCMVFIQTMSCILLAYNINRVGTIIQKIRSYQAQKNAHLKTFNHIQQNSQFSNQTKSRIMNYIKQSTQIRRNFNLGQQKQFIQSLPQSFKSDVLKQMNRHIWNGMMFFQNLSEETLVKLSITIQKKLAHPEEIVYTRGNDIDILVFNGGGFGYSYNNGNSSNNGNIMEHFTVGSKQYKIATLDFLFGGKLKYDIKCTDYSVIYRLSFNQLLKVLNNHSYDSEYFYMIKDKDKFLLNEYQLAECQLCRKQRHSVFKCPRLHFIPLRQHVIRKYKQKYFPRIFNYDDKRKSSKKFRVLINFKVNRKNIQSTRQFVNNYLTSVRSQHRLQSEELTEGQSQIERDELEIMNNEIKRQHSSFNSMKNIRTTRFYEQAIDEIRSKIDNLMHPSRFSWDLEIDVAFNYKFYFRKHNSDQIPNFTAKKNKLKIPFPKYKSITTSYGYRKRNKALNH